MSVEESRGEQVPSSVYLTGGDNQHVAGPRKWIIYDRSGGAPLRLVALASIFCTVASIVLATFVLHGQIVGARGDVPAARFDRLGVFGFSSCVFAGLSVATWWYARAMVSRVVLLPQGRALMVTSLALAGTRQRRVPLSMVSVAEAHTGDGAGEETFSGPWLRLRIGVRRTFLLPFNGPSHEMAGMVRLLERLSARDSTPCAPELRDPRNE